MKKITAFFVAIGIVVLVAVLMALPVMLLWNWLMPDIFGLVKIGFFQALGINVLSIILFKSKPFDTSESEA